MFKFAKGNRSCKERDSLKKLVDLTSTDYMEKKPDG